MNCSLTSLVTCALGSSGHPEKSTGKTNSSRMIMYVYDIWYIKIDGLVCPALDLQVPAAGNKPACYQWTTC